MEGNGEGRLKSGGWKGHRWGVDVLSDLRQ